MSSELTFESSASEGAILTMPDDTYQCDVRNLEIFYQYIGEHAKDWYEFANGPTMGRRIKNGDLCVVIGCDKSTTWGIATFSNTSNQATSRLQFRPTGQHSNTYTWEHSGRANVRIGPGRTNYGQTQSQPLRNQCLFVRYLTITLAPSVWKALKEPKGINIRAQSHSPGFSASKKR